MRITLQALARRRGDAQPAGKVVLPPWTNHNIRRSVRSQLSRLKIPEEIREAVLARVRPGIKGVYDHHDYFDLTKSARLCSYRLPFLLGFGFKPTEEVDVATEAFEDGDSGRPVNTASWC
jgi:hypothetical protein